MAGCSGTAYEFIPATPVQVKGDWEGTYSNNHIKDGVITATFFVDGDVLKVTYDIDDGYATGTSDVELDMRVITFYGVATDLIKFECGLSAHRLRNIWNAYRELRTAAGLGNGFSPLQSVEL